MEKIHLVGHDYGEYQSTFAFCGEEIYGEVGENKTNRIDKTTCEKCKEKHKKIFSKLAD